MASHPRSVLLVWFLAGLQGLVVEASQDQQPTTADENREASPSGGATPVGENEHEDTKVLALLLLGLLASVFLIALVGVRIYLRCARRRTQRECRRKKITAEEIVQRFPVTKAEGEPTCVVCLATIEADDECRVTQCGHTFHADCLLAWWMHKPKRALRCPICRTRQRFNKKKIQDSASQTEGCAPCPETVVEVNPDEETAHPSSSPASPSTDGKEDLSNSALRETNVVIKCCGEEAVAEAVANGCSPSWRQVEVMSCCGLGASIGDDDSEDVEVVTSMALRPGANIDAANIDATHMVV